MTEVRKRKLIEVSLPLEKINKESAREKSIRHGHPSTLHLWWSRKPLATARAVLFAQLVDDPSSHPDRFPTEEAQAIERKRLHDIIEELVVWGNANDERVLAKARKEIWDSCDGNPPPILDPFAGGGSIPLEAQRLGLEARASDLNPVAVLINKALVEIPPKWLNRPPTFPNAAASRLGDWPRATGLAEDVRRYGEWMRDEAKNRIGNLYPSAKLADGSEATVIAWIWARTVRCPNPACGIQMPLVNKWWLGKKKGKEAYVVPSVSDGRVVFSIGHDLASAPTKGNDGTVTRTGAICLGCRTGVPLDYVRAEGKARRLGTQLMAVAAEGDRRRLYLAPSDDQIQTASVPFPDDVPDTDLPKQALGFRVQAYGMTKHSDLFTNRQLVALSTFSDLVREAHSRVLADALASGDKRGESLEAGGSSALAYADSVAAFLAFAVSRQADYCCTMCSWMPDPKNEGIAHAFTRQAMPVIWDFAEVNPLSDSSGNWDFMIRGIGRVVDSLRAVGVGTVTQADAATVAMGGALVSTDPPYYDYVGYADLSDFFYVWLRRSLDNVFPKLLRTVLTPKAEELVADPFRHGNEETAEEFFEKGFGRVFAGIRRDTPPDLPITVYYAFKQSETDDHGEASTGWETLLEGLIGAGWTVTGTWPVRTERGGRMREIGSNALASSIVLACRPREDTARTTDRRGLIAALRADLPTRLREMQQGSIAPVDLAQAAIGPGMAVFSGYASVAEPNGEPMRIRTALTLINQVLAEVLTDQEGDLDADSRFALKWFEQYCWNEGRFGEADTLARAMNTSVDGLERVGVLKARAGKAQLLAPDDLPVGYDLSKDDRVVIWEVLQHLTRQLETGGIAAAARFMAQATGRVDVDAVKELGYLLYRICEQKSWTKEALRYNDLVTSWSDVDHGARSLPVRSQAAVQGNLLDTLTDGDGNY
jgi:putative DNA methylase